MNRRFNKITVILAALLLTLVMISGSFSASVYADGSVDEAAAGQVEENIDNTGSADSGVKPDTGEAHSVSGELPESSAEKPESAVEETAAEALEVVTEEPEAAADELEVTKEEDETVLSEAVKSEAKNEESSTTEVKKIKVSFSQASNGTVSAELRNGDSVTSISSGDTIDLTENANGTIYFTGQPATGYVVKQFTIKNGSKSAFIPGEKFRPGSTNQISVKVSAVEGDLSFTAEFEVRKYIIEVISDEEGSVTVDKTSAAEGETVQVRVVPAAGYRIDYAAYKYDDNNDNYYDYVYLDGDPATGIYSFKMPAIDVYVEAGFFRPVTVKIKESKGGSVTLKDRETGKEIKSGDEVAPYKQIVVEAKAKSGYSFSKWEFTAADGGYVSFFKRDSYFRMRNSDVTVEAIFNKNSSSSSSSSSSGTSSSYYVSQDTEEPAEDEPEEETLEEPEMLDVMPIVTRAVSETVFGTIASLGKLKF